MAETAPAPNRRWSGLSKFAKSPSRVYPLVFLLTYVVLFGYYDLRQVPKQRAALLAEDFRRLALASDQIRSRIENLAHLMEAQADRNRDQLNAVQQTNVDHYDPKPEPKALASDFVFSPCQDDQSQDDRSRQNRAQPIRQGISFVVMPGDDAVVHAEILKRDIHLCGDSPLKPDIEAATNGLIGRAFEDIALVAVSGRVIYQFQSSALRLASLGTLPEWTTSAVKPAAEGSQAGTATPNQAPPAPHDGIDYSRIVNLSFAEHNYKLLIQPLVLPAGDFASSESDRTPASLALVGIIDDSVLTARARSLPYATLINVTAAILLALIMTWPVLKIWKMGPAESFRPGETLGFGISLIVATWLLTVGIVYDIQVFSYESTDRSLDQLARNIEKNFADEVGAALKTLQTLSDGEDVGRDLMAVRSAKSGSPFQSRESILDSSTPVNALKAAGDYLWFDQVFWTDQTGEQILKWTTQRRATGKTKVAGEPWFAKVDHGQFWLLDPPHGKGDPQPLVLDSLYSPNTADYFGIVALPMDLSGQRVIATLITPFISVISPLLRPSDGFAILDEKGAVRFHSDPAKNLRENFLNEISPSRELKTAIATGARLRFTGHYNGNNVRVLSTPLSFLRNSDWTLIVFHDLTLKQRFFLNTLVLTVLYSLAYFVALAIAGRLGIKIIDRFARKLAEPKPDWYRCSERERLVLWALVACLVLLLCAFRLCSAFNFPLPLYLLIVLALPLSGVLLSYFALRYPSATGRLYRAGFSPAKYRWKAARVSVLATTLLLILLAIFPAIELFEIAFNDSVLANMQDAQIGLARNIESRNERIYAYSRRIDYGTAGTALQPSPALLEKRLAETRDRYTLPVPCGKGSMTNGSQWASSWLPRAERPSIPKEGAPPQPSWLFRHTADMLKELIPFPETFKTNASRETPWEWNLKEGCPGTAELDLSPSPAHADPQDSRAQYQDSIADFPIRSTVPAYPDHPVEPLLILLLIVFLYRFVNYTILRRLALDYVPPCPPWEVVPLRDLLQDVNRNSLCLDLPRNTDLNMIAPLNGEGSCQTFELESMLQDKDWEDRVKSCARLIVIFGFQHGVRNSELNAQTLSIVEKIVEDPNRKLLLISTVDPIYYLYQGQLREVRKLPADEIETYSRWMNALNSFDVVRTERDREKRLDREEWHLLWDTCAPREQLALWQLAHDGIVNPNNTSAIEHLFRRDIVNYDEETGHFRIFDPGFKRFVLSELPQRQLDLLIKSNKDTAWNGLKWAMIYTGLALPLFLAFTEADFWDLGLGKLLTFSSAGAAAVQTFSKIAELAGSRVSKG